MTNSHGKLLLQVIADKAGSQATERLGAFSFKQYCRTCFVKTCHMTLHLSLKLRLKPGEGNFLKNKIKKLLPRMGFIRCSQSYLSQACLFSVGIKVSSARHKWTNLKNAGVWS